MQESKAFTLLGMVSGLHLPQDVSELVLHSARIFRNPAAHRDPCGPPEMGPNTSICSGEGPQRHPAGEVATYLIEAGVAGPGGKLGHTRIRGTGGVTIGTSQAGGVTLSAGPNKSSAVSVAIPLGQAWDTPSLILDQFQRDVLPLRLLTKARILVFPAAVLASASAQKLLDSGIEKACPEPLGIALAARLSRDDCKTIQTFSRKLDRAGLEDYEVALSLFSHSFYRDDVVDRALDLITTLESLLSEGPDSIRYKLAFRASCLTAREGELWETFRFAYEAYGFRNAVIHGNKKTLARARTELGGRMERLEDLARRCLWLACSQEMEKVRLLSGKRATMRKLDLVDEFIFTRRLDQREATPLERYRQVGKLRVGGRIL